MQAPSVSIVIPTFQAGDHIAELIAQLSHHFPTSEIILIDDASKDDTWHQIMMASIPRSNFKAFRLEDNVGQHRSLLFGIKQAKGNLVLTFDDDMAAIVPALVNFAQKASSLNKDVVYAKFERIHQTGPRKLISKMLNIFLTTFSLLYKEASQIRLLGSDIRDSLQSREVDQFVFIDCLIPQITSSIDSLDLRTGYGAPSRYSVSKLITMTLRLLINYGQVLKILLIVLGAITVVIAILSQQWIFGMGIILIVFAQRSQDFFRRTINKVTPLTIIDSIEK